MSTVLERIRAARESLTGGGILGEGFGLQGIAGGGVGGKTIRAAAATRIAGVLRVSPPAATSAMPVIDTVREKVLAVRPAPAGGGGSAPRTQAFSPPTVVPRAKAQFG